MFGFLFGTVCLFALFKVLRRTHRFYGGHGGYGCQGGYRTGGYGGRWLMRSLFERLETTPGQERAILGALDELRENRRAIREEARQTRGDVARVVRGGLVDDSSLEETFHRHDRLLAQLRVSFVESLKKALEPLDERQRKQLADLLEGERMFGRGPRFGGPFGAWV